MSQDKKETEKRLFEIWKNNDIKVLDTIGEKYAVFSDVHLGDGGEADDFHKNEEAFLTALEFYRADDYKIILLGDIEELWQFDLKQIVNRYNESVYKKIREFGKDRVYRIYGNHDLEWGILYDPTVKKSATQKITPEAIKMRDNQGKVCILLVHGHQGSVESDKNSWISRILVRRLWTPIEPLAVKLGIYTHPSATKSQVTKDYEKILYSWAKKNKVILICGHSHRAIFASKSYAEKLEEEIAELQAEIQIYRADRAKKKDKIKKIFKLIEMKQKKLLEEKEKNRDIDPTEDGSEPFPFYFNSGSALYTDGITNLEIAEEKIKLVKWHKDITKEPKFHIYDSENLGTITCSDG